MNIITSKPIVINGKVMNNENYSNFPDAPLPSGAPLPYYTSPTAPPVTQTTAGTRAERIKAGLDKAKGVYQKGQESGLFASLGNLLGLGKKETPAVSPIVAPAPEPTKDNTMKYVLIGGGVLAVGVIVYLATREK
jgi:L-2-hydroxyglutarate oxidase LhgO